MCVCGKRNRHAGIADSHERDPAEHTDGLVQLAVHTAPRAFFLTPTEFFQAPLRGHQRMRPVMPRNVMPTPIQPTIGRPVRPPSEKLPCSPCIRSDTGVRTPSRVPRTSSETGSTKTCT